MHDSQRMIDVIKRTARVFALVLMGCSTGLAAPFPVAPGATFFSPQISPDGSAVVWESLERGGSIWIVPRGGEPRFLVQGHSPSWVDETGIQFVVSRDDGHQILEQNLFRMDVAGAGPTLLAADSDNPQYQCVKMPVEAALYPDRPLSGVTVCLDPGHGSNSGAKSPHTGIYEDAHVLDSAEVVRDYLEASGARVKLTRVDNSICPSLSSRVNFSNSVGARLFCSIHYNSATNQSAHGLEVIHRSWVEGSKDQARKIHDRMVASTGMSSRGVKGDKEVLGFYLGVLSSSHKITRRCLTEGGFLSNASDARTIATPEFNERISWGIYAGICDTLGVAPNRPMSMDAQSIDEHFRGPLDHAWIGSRASIFETETPEGDGRALRMDGEAFACSTLRSGGSAWKDYEVSAVLRGRGQAYGLVAHSASASGRRFTGYVLVCDDEAGRARLYAVPGKLSGMKVLAEAPLPAANLADGWRELVLRCHGDRVQATVCGTELSGPMQIQGQDGKWSARRGKAGFFLAGGGAASELLVDSFQLRPLD